MFIDHTTVKMYNLKPPRCIFVWCPCLRGLLTIVGDRRARVKAQRSEFLVVRTGLGRNCTRYGARVLARAFCGSTVRRGVRTWNNNKQRDS